MTTSHSATQPSVEHPHLQQIPFQPIDAYGLTASVVGTLLFGLAGMVCWLLDYRGLWLIIVLVAAGLGLLLIPITAWLRHRSLNRRIKSKTQSKTEVAAESP